MRVMTLMKHPMKRLITLILLACSLCLQAQVKMMKGANDPIGTPKEDITARSASIVWSSTKMERLSL